MGIGREQQVSLLKKKKKRGRGGSVHVRSMGGKRKREGKATLRRLYHQRKKEKATRRERGRLPGQDCDYACALFEEGGKERRGKKEKREGRGRGEEEARFRFGSWAEVGRNNKQGESAEGGRWKENDRPV